MKALKIVCQTFTIDSAKAGDISCRCSKKFDCNEDVTTTFYMKGLQLFNPGSFISITKVLDSGFQLG